MFLLNLLVLLQLSLLQQNTICIIDNVTGKPLADCHVQVDGETVGVTNANGVWGVSDVYRNSTVCISHVGYKSECVSLSQLGRGERMIALDYAAFAIDEVVVSRKRQHAKLISMGVTGKKRTDYEGVKLFDGWLKGHYIPNSKKSRNFEIQQVRIYISDDAVAPTASFWISIYAGEKEYIAPKEENKLYGPLLTRASNRGEYHTINVSHAHIKMPQGGVFIVLQNNPANEVQTFVKHYANGRSARLKSKTGFSIPENVTASKTYRANCTTIGESWQYCNRFYKWGGHVSAEGSTIGYDGNPIKWKRDTVQWELYPKNHSVGSGNSMIYVVLKEIK